ncbi:hypothetical protein XELAEV_18038325mg [Xenopus laevis]|uniref:Uncharacterized protein n=1 Tax=Xenopus laevis TaxID=8355 RepID=A0A974C5U4_XENLA|nr:hypothetical protein XELAEV_18038325mg [Xenopus laevis]
MEDPNSRTRALIVTSGRSYVSCREHHFIGGCRPEMESQTGSRKHFVGQNLDKKKLMSLSVCNLTESPENKSIKLPQDIL